MISKYYPLSYDSGQVIPALAYWPRVAELLLMGFPFDCMAPHLFLRFSVAQGSMLHALKAFHVF